MGISNDEILHEIIKLPALKKMQASAKMSLQSGVLVGASTMLSGLVLGPVGLALGGILSSCTACALTYGKFEAIPDIIMNDLTADQKSKLGEAIRMKLMENMNMDNMAKAKDLIIAVQSNEILLQLIVQLITSFLSSELNRKVCL